MNDSKKLDLHSQRVFGRLDKFYEEKVNALMDSNPDSYTMIKDFDFSCYFDKKKEKKEPTYSRSIKRSHLPPICEKMGKFLKEQIPYETMLENYESIVRYNIRGGLTEKIAELLNVAYKDQHIPLYDHIQMAPLHWVKFERFSEEETRLVYNSITTELDKPFGDERFEARPIHANRQYGMSDNTGIHYKKKEFNIRYFCDESNCYKDQVSSQVYMDARLGLMFYFKGKPSFFISFFIDFDMNVYIRQIQGLRKSRGHYVLGKEWQKEVVNFIKKRFSFANEIRVITEDAAFNYLQKLYADDDVRESVEPTLRKASSVYAMFNNGCDIIDHDTYIMKGLCERISIKDKYYIV